MQPQITPTTKQAPPLVWNSQESTYYWYIDLNPDYIYNGKYQRNQDGSGKVITGYSMTQRQSEGMDKQKVLRRVIKMIKENGYLTDKQGLNVFRTKLITVYHRKGPVIDKRRDFSILLLSPHKSFFTAENGGWLPSLETKEYLQDEYRKLVTEEPLPKPIKSDKEIYLDIDYQFLKLGNNFEAMKAYCSRLRNNGHDMEDVVNFFNAYKAKYLG